VGLSPVGLSPVGLSPVGLSPVGLSPCCPSGYLCEDCNCTPGSEECAEEFEAISSILGQDINLEDKVN